MQLARLTLFDALSCMALRVAAPREALEHGEREGVDREKETLDWVLTLSGLHAGA